jgi:hypothetical protein
VGGEAGECRERRANKKRKELNAVNECGKMCILMKCFFESGPPAGRGCLRL